MRWLAFTLILATLALSGCLTPGTVEPPLQYFIEPAPEIPVATTIPVTLGVRPLMAARPYETLPMAYLTQGGVLAYYAKDQWAEMPADLLTRALIDAASRSGRFLDAGDAATLARPDWQLTGELRKFHEWREGEVNAAVVELRLEMREARDRTLLWAATLNQSTPVEDTGAAGVAAAMKSSIERLMEDAAKEFTAVALPEVN